MLGAKPGRLARLSVATSCAKPRKSNAEILVRDTRGRRGCRTHRAWLGGNWGSLIRNDRTNVCGRSGIREKIKAFQFFVAEKRSLAGNWND
jgi:hypothetical protein